MNAPAVGAVELFYDVIVNYDSIYKLTTDRPKTRWVGKHSRRILTVHVWIQVGPAGKWVFCQPTGVSRHQRPLAHGVVARLGISVVTILAKVLKRKHGRSGPLCHIAESRVADDVRYDAHIVGQLGGAPQAVDV
jgi:hypothetical protein